MGVRITEGSSSALPAHASRAHGASGATHLCVSLVADSASNFAGSSYNITKHLCQAEPIATQLGCRLACSPPLALEKGVTIEHHLPFQHVINGSGQLMGQDGQGLALPVLFLSAGEILLARRIVAEEQDGRFGEGPLEIRIANLRAGGAIPLAR